MRLPSSAVLSLVALLALPACTPSSDDPDLPEAATLIAEAREAHGSARLDTSTVTFTFRGSGYEAARTGGAYRYTRTTEDDRGSVVKEVLTNDGPELYVDGEPVQLTPDDAAALATRVNSVVYFALLPYNLTDPAVRAATLGADTLGGEPYWIVGVSFTREGGGPDYEDRYAYWLHRDRQTMDYLAYDFHVNGGGARFRAARDARAVDGVRFADYLNYSAPQTLPLRELGRAWEAGRLELLSTIATEEIRVR